MKSIAILTMVYDDDIYLKIWLGYWERFVPRSNLYVLIHADYEHYEEMAKGCNTIRIARPALHRDFEVDRWKMLSELASGLTYMFGRVIYTDVDEIIALDPVTGSNPVDYILGQPEPVISPYGLDVVDPIELDLPQISFGKPILSQRAFVSSSAPYSKPCIISRPTVWSTGGHYCDYKDVHLSEHLFLFHLKLFDKSNYLERAFKRKQMVMDPASGTLLLGAGGADWKKTSAFGRYSIEDPTPLAKIDFRKDRAKWLETANIDESTGLWHRKGRLRKNLYRLPIRFEAVF